MKSENRVRWLLIAALASLTVVGAWRVRHRLLDATQQRLVRSYQQRLISLPEREATSLIQRLAQSDDQFLEILVWASADDRPFVSMTAQRELQDLVDQWSSLQPHESSNRAAMLARQLAVHAASMPPERRDLAHSLAQRLILWPVDGRQVDTARFIADCQSVLLLPQSEQTEIRVAAVPEARPVDTAAPGPAPELQQPLLAPDPQTREPSPAEPRPFTASPGLRISDQ
jgi:hypothetical protein